MLFVHLPSAACQLVLAGSHFFPLGTATVANARSNAYSIHTGQTKYPKDQGDYQKPSARRTSLFPFPRIVPFSPFSSPPRCRTVSIAATILLRRTVSHQLINRSHIMLSSASSDHQRPSSWKESSRPRSRLHPGRHATSSGWISSCF
jgi:hypothetical protein